MFSRLQFLLIFIQFAIVGATLLKVFLNTGIRSVLFVVFTFVVAHNILYIYLEPFLGSSGLSANVETALFVFGLGSIVGLWGVGATVDRRLRFLIVASILVFAAAALLLDLMLAGHRGSSLGGGAHGQFEPRRAGLFRPR